VRSALKRGLYRGLVALQAPRLARQLYPGATILCFHNVVADGEAGLGDASLHMPVSVFESLVRWLAATYRVVPLRELAERASAGRRVRNLAALTFDDAYRGVFEHALPRLEEAGLPCTLFVVTGFAAAPAPTWWDTLAARGLLSEERRARALVAQQGLAGRVLADCGDDGRAADTPDVLLPARWEWISRAAGDLVAVGSHTARHPNLTVLNDTELEDELGRSRREILEHTNQDPEAVAYPYGLSDSRVARAAARAGYRMGLTLEGGPMTAGRDLLAAPRLNVPAGISPEALACWTAGIRPRRPW